MSDLKPMRAKDVYSLFVVLGGVTKVAERFGVRKSTTSEMTRRGTVPPWHWPTLKKMAKDAGYELRYEQLVNMAVDAKQANRSV